MAINVAYLLNTMYPKGLADATYREAKNDSFLLLVKKNPNCNGSSFDVVVQYSLGGGSSTKYAKARTNSNGTNGVRFNLPYQDEYALAKVEAKDMKAAEGNGGVVDVLENKLTAAQKQIRLALASGVARDRSGEVARIKEIAPTTPANSFRVYNSYELRMISKGVVLQSNPNRTGNAGTIRSGTALVERVIKQPGTAGGLVYYTAQNGWAPSVDDYIYVDGNYDAKMTGVEAWIPTTEPVVGESFHGVDRSVDSQALAGSRVDASGENSHENAILASLEQFRTYSAGLTHMFMNPYDFGRLEKELSTRKRIVEVPTEYEIGISGMELADGTMVLSDPNFRKGFAWALDMDTWTLMSMGEAPHIANEDGLKMARALDVDGFEAYFRAWVNLKCSDPSQNGVVKLPA